jgi:hypothetical protein
MHGVPNVSTVLAHDTFTRGLLDREIMLTCLTEAADTGRESDLVSGRPARRVLDVRLRTTQSRRRAAVQRAMASATRPRRSALTPIRPERGRAVSPAALESAAAMAKMVLNVRRGELEMHRLDAAELRSSARALRAEAHQIRLRTRRLRL